MERGDVSRAGGGMGGGGAASAPLLNLATQAANASAKANKRDHCDGSSARHGWHGV